jgi:hypothetical protein
MVEIKEAPRAKTEAKGQSQMKEVERRSPGSVPVEFHPLTFMRRFADEMDRLYEGFGL